jgi:hypothetical protein
MLQLMRETKETLAQAGPVRWSAEAINLVEATSSASYSELSDVSIDQVAVNHCSSVYSIFL